MPQLPRFRLHTRMGGRDIEEEHRVSSPLELLFDLTFVVAVAQVAAQLAQSIGDGTVLQGGLVPYLMVFFAIWWAWMNFTWFASAYDTDDVPYRLLTILQMAGVLVLAAGVPSAFAHGDFLGVTIGYVIMRIALVVQWIRAGIEDPSGRTTAFRYAAGIVVVQLGWVARLFLPDPIGFAAFFVLVLADVAVPPWAERTRRTRWHPHHIAERYGLFTIILLGESVSAAALAVQRFLTSNGVSPGLVTVALAGLVLIFALWWLYFMVPVAEGLERRRERSFVWGYGHYFLFAAVAAVGAALEVAVESGTEHFSTSGIAVGYALAVPVACFLVLLYLLHAPIVEDVVVRLVGVVVAAVLVLLLPLATPAVGIPLTVAGIALVAALLVVATILDNLRGRQKT